MRRKNYNSGEMKKTYIFLSILILSVVGMSAQTTLTPSQILAKAVGVVSGSKGVSATFTLSGSGYAGRGEIKTLGSKFSVKLPDVEVWYNGKNLYTYNKRAGETTLINPTAEELAETNPLAYISGAQKNYNVTFSTVKKAGKYVLELTPKTKGVVKRITLTLNKSTYSPEKIVMEPTSGSPLTAEISAVKTGVALGAAEFEYPKAKYPKVEIVDLR